MRFKKSIKYFILFGGIIFFLLSANTIYSYYQANSLINSGDKLVAQSNYQEGINQYRKSQQYWINEKVNDKIRETEILVESDKSYKEGLDYIDQKDWDKAIILFLKIDKSYKFYDNSRLLIDRAKEKIEEIEQKEEELRKTKENQSTKYTIKKTIIPTAVPTENIQPTNTEPTTQPINENQNKEVERQQNYLKCTQEIDKFRSEQMDKCYQQYKGDNFTYNMCVNTVNGLYNKGREDCTNLFGN